MPNQENKNVEAEEITIKELFFFVKDQIVILWKNIIWLILAGLVMGVILAFSVWGSIPEYKGTSSFMLEGEKSNAGALSLISSFGLGGGEGVSLEKVMYLIKTRKIIQSSLFEKAEVGDTLDYFANHLIRLNNFHEKWVGDTTGLDGFYFTHDNIDSFSLTENQVLKGCHFTVIGGEDVVGMLTSEVLEVGIMLLSINSKSPEFSIGFNNVLLDKLSDFYVSKTIEKQKKTFDVFRNRSDSINIELNSVQSRLANFDDSNKGLFRAKSYLPKASLQRRFTELVAISTEVTKNLELARFNLMQKTPFLQVIDRPIPPLKPNKPSIIIRFVIGAILGGFLAAIFIIGKGIFKNIMAED